jgi:hypothetical protein
MAFIGQGFDFNNDGHADAIIGMNTSAVREQVCGRTLRHESRDLLSQQLDLPNCACVILKCGFCHQKSVAYSKCPWCGAAGTWQHDRNLKFNSGWLECSRCENRLGDNPCPKCGRENSVSNFHLLEYKSEEELRRERVAKKGYAAAWKATVVGSCLNALIFSAFGLLKFSGIIPGSEDRSVAKAIWIIAMLGLVAAAWIVPLGWAVYVKLKNDRDSLLDKQSRVAPVVVPNPKAKLVGPPPPPPVAVHVQWWIRAPDGRQSGPYTKECLARALTAGKLPQGTVAANSPNGPWRPVQVKKSN